MLEPVVPAFDLPALIGLAAPLFLVTLVSQNLPGLMVLRSAGYEPPTQPILLVSGATTMLMAPFGAQGVNMAAITAAICVNSEAHPDSTKRWIVGVLYGGCYLLLALFSAPLVSLFLALPQPTIAAIIGIALIPPLLGAMDGMMKSPDHREAAMLTFVATASGMVLGGLGAAFWGLVAGVVALGAGKVLRAPVDPPGQLMHSRAMPTADQIYRAIAPAVDAVFYRAAYADLGPLGRDPVGHYVRLGWREGRDPAPWFSTEAYLDGNPDVAQAGLNPFHHYLTLGRAQGRDVRASDLAPVYMADPPALGPAWTFDIAAMPPVGAMTGKVGMITTDDRALVATEFDEAFYLSANPDVTAGGWAPLEHFLRLGWKQGRDPHDGFCVEDYLEANPDVAAEGINPFLHYLRSGRAEGRSPRNLLGPRYPIIARAEPVEARMARAAALNARVEAQGIAVLRKALETSRGGGLHLTFSHDDYVANVGGVQSCLQREAAAIAGRGRDHLHLFPAEPWPMIRAGEGSLLGVLWNGTALGAFDAGDIAEAMGGLAPGPRSFAIHSQLGHAADETLAILAAVGAREGFFWLHDFAGLCAGYHLLRNDAADCGAPPPDSAACGVCLYGEHRARHLSEYGKLFEALALTVVAPSQSALDTWKRGGGHRAAAEIILPHARLVAPRPAPPARSGPLKVAFLGWASPLKGWPVFRDLARRHADDRRYAFLHLGKHPQGGLPILFHEVAVTPETPLAMRDAIARLGVDVALIWPLCRETFSFTAYEATAAGAAILTSPDSGNVAAFVEASGNGRVLADEAALVRLFETGGILDLARSVRAPTLADLAYSDMTAELVS